MRLKPAMMHVAWAAAMLSLGCAQAEAAPLHSGVWSGVYQCAQGLTGARLSLSVGPDGAATGLFEFYAVKNNPTVPRGCFEMAGRVDADGRLALAPGAWRLHPAGFVTVSLAGQQIAGNRLVGQVQGPGCSSFALMPAKIGAFQAAPSACVGVIS